MVAHVLNLSRWEWFKLRRRWMPWVLLGIAVLITQISLWSSFASYQTSDVPALSETTVTFESGVPHPDGGPIVLQVGCGDTLDQAVPPDVLSRLSEDDRARLDEEIGWELRRCGGRIARESARNESKEGFVLPGSLSNALALGSSVGVVLIMVLASSVIGVEYGWGTLRTTLTKGPGRWQLLAAKLLTLLLVGAAAFIVVSLAIAVSSLIGSGLTLGDGGGLAGAGQWSTVFAVFGKAVYSLAPYIILAAFFAVLTSSSSVGVSIALGYYFAELVVVGILGSLFDWFETVSGFLLGPSVRTWMADGGVSGIGSSGGQGMLHAFLVITVYAAVIGGAAFWLFQHKDVSGAKGG